MGAEKENLGRISEDDLAEPASFKLTPSEFKRKRTSGNCNLRKSLAWNNAFFTEEGVLDPLELSRLSGSIMNSGEKSLCEITVGPLSPLTELNHCSSQLKTQHFISNSSTNQLAKSERKVLDATQSPLKPIFEEEKTHWVPVKKALPKGSHEKPPQAPTAYSQKRVAHVAQTNPTTKLQKVMPKPKLTVSAGNFQQKATSLSGVPSNQIEFGRSLSDKTSTSRRGVSSTMKEFGRSLSAWSSRQDSAKRKFQNDHKALHCSKSPSSTSSAKLLEPSSHGSCDMASAVTQNHNHTGISAPVLAKPTALRMPSPALGFFSQGKAPLSYKDPSHQNMKPAISSLPSRKGTCVGVPKFLSTSGGQNPVVGPTVRIPRSEGVVTSKSILQSSVASRSKLSVHGAEISAKSKKEMVRPENVISRSIPQSSVASRSKLSVHGAEKAAKSKKEMKEMSEGVIFKSIPQSSIARCSNLSVDGREIPAKLDLDRKDTNGTDRLISGCYSPPHELGQDSSFLAMSDADRNKEVHGQLNLLQMNQGSSYEGRRLAKQIPAKVAPHNSSHTRPISDPSGHVFFPTEISTTAEGNCVMKSCLKQPKDCSLIERIDNACNDEDANIIGSGRPTPRTGQEHSHMQVSHIEADHAVAHKTALFACHATTEDVDLEVQPTASDGNEDEDCRVIHMKPAEAREEKEECSHMITKGTSLQNVNKPDALALTCQINAPPFSNEWLAALEAFGEDILQLKTGPVQNSPTEKAPPAPGPWSPVKRKAQDIGPFDCTKYLKNNSSMDAQ